MITRTEYSTLRQGLVGAWCPSLGASGLSLIDRSGRSNSGTLVNVAGQDSWRSSGSGLALNFDGTNDRVSTSLVPTIAGQCSYSVWIYPRVLNSYQAVFSTYTSNAASLELFVDVSGSRFVAVNFSNTTATAAASVNAWQHLAVATNGTAASIYVNGVLASSPTITAISQSSSALSIGGRAAATNFFNGLIDDFRLYTRTLTAPEVRLLASRRGIGLTPLADRGASLPRRWSVNVGGTWRPADSYLNVGGTWRLGQPSVNVAGTWR